MRFYQDSVQSSSFLFFYTVIEHLSAPEKGRAGGCFFDNFFNIGGVKDALETITSIDDLPKFVDDMSAQYQRNPIIPFVPHDLIQQLGAMASQR